VSAAVGVFGGGGELSAVFTGSGQEDALSACITLYPLNCSLNFILLTSVLLAELVGVEPG